MSQELKGEEQETGVEKSPADIHGNGWGEYSRKKGQFQGLISVAHKHLEIDEEELARKSEKGHLMM